MLTKEKDAIADRLGQLEAILTLANLPKTKQLQVEKEIKILKAGDRGEKNSAYFINFHYEKAKNWAIIHDLRIEYGGRTAQIDHLLIGRFLDIYILETKNFTRTLKITERGEFFTLFHNHYEAIESPIEQNNRHLIILQDLLKNEDILPTRFGFRLQPQFYPYVLVSPQSRVIRPDSKVFNTDRVIKADEFYKKTQANGESEGVLTAITSVVNYLSEDALREVAQKLARYHRPLTIDYYERFGIPKITNPTPPENPKTRAPQSSYFCYQCKGKIPEKVAIFCFTHRSRFQGKAYCLNCQKQFAPPTKGESKT